LLGIAYKAVFPKKKKWKGVGGWGDGAPHPLLSRIFVARFSPEKLVVGLISRARKEQDCFSGYITQCTANVRTVSDSI